MANLNAGNTGTSTTGNSFSAVVQFLFHSSSLANALGNGNLMGRPLTPSLTSHSEGTVTASTIASKTSSSNIGELNGPTTRPSVNTPDSSTRSRASSSANQNVNSNVDGAGEGRTPASSFSKPSTPPSTSHRSISPSDSLASSRHNSPNPVATQEQPNLEQEEAMDLDSDVEDSRQGVQVYIPTTPTPSENTSSFDKVPDSAIELGKRPFETRSLDAGAGDDLDSQAKGDERNTFFAKRARLSVAPALNKSPTSSSSSLIEAEAFLDAVASNITTTVQSPKDGDEANPGVLSGEPMARSPDAMSVEPEAEEPSAKTTTSTVLRTASRSVREAQIWDGAHPEIENSTTNERIRRASGAWEEQEHSGDVDTAEVHIASADASTLPSNESIQPTYTNTNASPVHVSSLTEPIPDLITSPGIWALRSGLDSLGFLPIELELDDKIANRVRRWSDIFRSHTSIEPIPPVPDSSLSSAQPALIVSLFCLPQSVVQAMADGVSADLDAEYWMPTAYGDECMKRVEREGACVWPEKGLCVEVNGKAAGVIGGRVMKMTNTTSPLDISRHIRSGPNTVRLVQLRDLSDFAFVVYCREANNEELALNSSTTTATVTTPISSEEEKVLEKVRGVVRRAKERMRRERGGEKGRVATAQAARVGAA